MVQSRVLSAFCGENNRSRTFAYYLMFCNNTQDVMNSLFEVQTAQKRAGPVELLFFLATTNTSVQFGLVITLQIYTTVEAAPPQHASISNNRC